MKRTGKYTKRLIVIIAGLFLVILLAWRAAFSPTIRLWQEGKETKEQLLLIDQAPLQLARLNEQLKLVDQMIGNSSGEVKQEDIVNAISGYIAENKQLALCSLPPVHLSENQDYQVKTFSVELQGNFEQLVRFLHYFEMQRNIGKFSSAEFFLVRDHATKRKELRLKIYIQSFIKK